MLLILRYFILSYVVEPYLNTSIINTTAFNSLGEVILEKLYFYDS